MAYSDLILSESSLVSYWRLGESSGTTATDAKGTQNGTYSNVTLGASSLYAGESDTAATFNGTTSKVSLGSSSFLNYEYTQAWSVEFVIKPNSDRTGTYLGAAILSKLDSNPQYPGFEIATEYNGNVASKNVINLFIVNDFGATKRIQVYGSTDLANATTYHIIVKYSGNGLASGLKVYIDGVEETLSVAGDGLLGNSILNGITPHIGCRNGVANFYKGDLDEVSVYNTALTSSQIARHAAQRLATIDGVTAPWSERPKLIIDTDCVNDCGDPGALAVACALANRNECDILAFVTNTATADVAGSVDAIATYYGQIAQPIGERASGSPESTAPSGWVSYLPANFPLSSTRAGTYPDSVNTYRQALHDAADASVTICSIGFMGVLRDLMVSSADGIDSRNGMDLIAAKVIRLVVMGGQYLTGTEYNFAQEPSATTGASYVVANWSSSIPIYFSGFELGDQIIAGSGLSATPLSNPVRYCYNDEGRLGTGQNAWDETAILFAVRKQYYDNAYYWTLTRGTNSVNGTTGANTFTPGGGGPHYYLTLKAPAELVSTILDGLTAAAPPRATPPQLAMYRLLHLLTR